MSRSKFPVWQTVLVAAIFILCNCETNFAQSINGFSKSSRGYGPSPAAKSQGGQNSNANRGGQSRGNRGNGNASRGHQGHSHGSHSNGSRNRNNSQRFNHHSFYPSRSVIGSGHRYSPGHFHGHYVPLRPFGYVDPYGYGYGGLAYPAPYAYGYSGQGFNNGVGFNRGYGNYNPAYSTYGSTLNNGGVLNSNVIGSSVAAQALERLRNQQAVIPTAPAANTARDAEILRLQIELERAKQALANQQLPQQQQTQTLKPPVQEMPQQSTQEVVDQLGLAAIIETNQLAAASHLKAERAFRSGDYGQAARFSGLAISLDESNGKLLLFASQAHFANGEYRESATTLTKAHSVLPSEEMGWVVENFKLFYGQNDFVSQIKQLSSHLKQSPSDARAWLLRGYQYGALGYPDAATKDLQRAKELGASSELVETFLTRFTAEVVVE